MKIDVKQLKSDLVATAAELKELKGKFRESGQPRVTKDDYTALRCGKEWFTTLCVIRAHARGRVHLKGKTLEEQGEILGNEWQSFRLKEMAA